MDKNSILGKTLVMCIVWLLIWQIVIVTSGKGSIVEGAPQDIGDGASSQEIDEINKEKAFSLGVFVGTITDLIQLEDPAGEICWFFRPVNMLWVWIVYYGGELQEFSVQIFHENDLLPFLLIDDYFHGLLTRHFICGFTLWH